MNVDNNNNLDIKLKKEKKINSISIIILIISFLVIAGGTYAYFNARISKNNVTASANCYTVNYTKGQDIAGELEASSSYINAQSTDIVMYANPECELLTGTLYITTNLDSTMDLSDKALKYTVVLNEQVVSEGSITGKTNQPIYSGFILNTTPTTYKVYVWLDQNLEGILTTDESYSGFIHADVVVSSKLPSSQLTMLNLGLLEEIENETLTTFTTTSKLDGTTGIYSAEDDLGTSYYFRGNVTNNYVKFGKYTEDAYRIIQQDSNGIWSYSFDNACPGTYYGCAKIASAGDDMYWRIVRVNGDGTVRLIYDGIDKFTNNDTRKTAYNNAIGTARYNSLYDDNTYVGYMYGEAGSDNYADTHTNTNDSELKKIIDAWYEKYIYGKYDSYIADAIYCNDRTRVTDSEINDSLRRYLGFEENSLTGEGFGKIGTIYSIYNRMNDTLTEVTPTLKCNQENDRFTKENKIGEVTGNGMLQYPVATINADEAILAGSFILFGTSTQLNDEMYLYTSGDYWFWTMSPSFYKEYARGIGVNNGYANNRYLNRGDDAIRPVISLNENILRYGTGTMEDPYRVDYYDDIDNSGANAPAYVENLIPVMYDDTTNNWVVADTTSSTSTYGWYDYDAKKWANAVLVNDSKREELNASYKNPDGRYVPGTPIGDSEADGVLAFYVWIPRYKYKVWNIDKIPGTDTYEETNAFDNGIDIKFENGRETTGTITCRYSFAESSGVAGEPNEICNDVQDGEGYYTHPAFKFGNDNVTGFWMGKFELSSLDQTVENWGGGVTTDLAPRILPNVMSWRENSVGNFWKVIKDMQVENNIYGLTTDTTIADTHMLTNMEWGAVAYLTHSEYGRCTNNVCTEVATNNSGETTNWTNYTGRSAGAPGSSSTELGTYTYDGKDTSTWNFVTDRTLGTTASTTENIYGVYDMSGGAGEYVMGNMSSTSGYYEYYKNLAGNNYVYEENEKYITIYAYGTIHYGQHASNRGKLGDAVSETMVLYDESVQGERWYNDYSIFIYSNSPWLFRGAVFHTTHSTGIFAVDSWTGADAQNLGTRAILIGF